LYTSHKPIQNSTFSIYQLYEAQQTATVENFFGLFLSITFLLFKFGHNLTNMAIIKKTKSFGEHLRNLREGANLTLKSVSEDIGIDTSLLAKIERNERQPTKQIIKEIAEYFNVDEKELQNDFLSDQIAYKILDEEADLSILKVAEEKVKYLKAVHNGK
jgi:transcriptional regulator with XRE-family HTH domain